MAKVIKYPFLSCRVNRGTEENPQWEDIFLEKTLSWSEGNEEIAKREARDGVYTVEEDGRPAKEATTDAVMNCLLGVTG